MSNKQNDQQAPQEKAEGTRGLNNPTQVEQDNRVAQVAAEAKAKGQGSQQSEDEVNKDG